MISFTQSFLQELLSQKIALNIYVFNSVMNVNAHDLNFSLQVYKNMKVMLLSLSLLVFECEVNLNE